MYTDIQNTQFSFSSKLLKFFLNCPQFSDFSVNSIHTNGHFSFSLKSVETILVGHSTFFVKLCFSIALYYPDISRSLKFCEIIDLFTNTLAPTACLSFSFQQNPPFGFLAVFHAMPPLDASFCSFFP